MPSNRRQRKLEVGWGTVPPQSPDLPPSPTAAGATRALIFAEVLTGGPLSRTDVARRTGLSQSTVTKAVNPLIDMGYLLEDGEKSQGLGRPQRLVHVARDRHFLIGVKLGPRHLTAVMTDLAAEIVGRARRELAGDHSPETVFAAAAEMVRELLDARPAAVDRVLGIGV